MKVIIMTKTYLHDEYQEVIAQSLEYDKTIELSQKTAERIRKIPAPVRGQILRTFGDLLRRHRNTSAVILTQSMGKHIRESQGEVQECIDMVDYAVGLSRMYGGQTLQSERPNHRLQETWEPLGVVGIITAFNFPMAVWAWNFCLAFVTGNSTIWKPSPHAEGCAKELKMLWDKSIEVWSGQTNTDSLWLRDAVQVLYGDAAVSQAMARDTRIQLISFTGSTKAGKRIARVVGARLGKVLLELGGNNSSIIDTTANLDLAIRACVFAAVGTSGQRCTTLRRLFVQHKIYNDVVRRLKEAFDSLSCGEPMDESVLVGPLLNEASWKQAEAAIYTAQLQGAKLEAGGVLDTAMPWTSTHQYQGPVMRPALMTCVQPIPQMQTEVFAPILYVVPYGPFDEAIHYANQTEYGLSSSIFSNDQKSIEEFLRNSYNGLVNVNTSTSGAEIGLAFGGVKSTGWGTESGSDSWKQYCRRVSTCINYGSDLPLAQGINFGE